MTFQVIVPGGRGREALRLMVNLRVADPSQSDTVRCMTISSNRCGGTGCVRRRYGLPDRFGAVQIVAIACDHASLAERAAATVPCIIVPQEAWKDALYDSVARRFAAVEASFVLPCLT